MVLRGEDVAGRPAKFGTQCLQRLDQDRRLDRHVQRAGNFRALERLRGAIFLAHGHQAGHFGFGDADFLASVIGKADIGNDVIGEGGGSHAQFSWHFGDSIAGAPCDTNIFGIPKAAFAPRKGILTA